MATTEVSPPIPYLLIPYLLTVNEAAQYLTVKPCTVRKWIRLKRIPSTKLFGAVRIQKSVLDELIAQSTRKAR